MDAAIPFSWHHRPTGSPLLLQASTRWLHSASRCCRLAFCILSICSMSLPHYLRVLYTIPYYLILRCTSLDSYSVADFSSLGNALRNLTVTLFLSVSMCYSVQQIGICCSVKLKVSSVIDFPQISLHQSSKFLAF